MLPIASSGMCSDNWDSAQSSRAWLMLYCLNGQKFELKVRFMDPKEKSPMRYG